MSEIVTIFKELGVLGLIIVVFFYVVVKRTITIRIGDSPNNHVYSKFQKESRDDRTDNFIMLDKDAK